MLPRGPLQNPDLLMVEKMKRLMFGDVLFEAEGLIYGVQGYEGLFAQLIFNITHKTQHSGTPLLLNI